MAKKVKRFQVIKVPANKIGDNTKPTRFAINVENSEEKETILVATQYSLTDSNGKETNSMDRKRKGYVKELYNKNKRRRVGVGIDLFEVDRDDLVGTGKIYTGRNKRRILNQIYNEADKKSSKQKRIVKNNREKRKKYKSKEKKEQ